MIEAFEISKTFGKRAILDKLSFHVEKGDFISIVGDSGTGKTTLLNILGLLENPSSGYISINGVANPSKKQKMLMQRDTLGYVFQNFALIENDTVENNLKIAISYQKGVNAKVEISNALAYVGLTGFEKMKVYELSGGEQQRVAMARVVIKKCEYIFADEPTGNLDRRNRDLIFDLFRKLNGEGRTIIYVTHDLELASFANWKIAL